MDCFFESGNLRSVFSFELDLGSFKCHKNVSLRITFKLLFEVFPKSISDNERSGGGFQLGQTMESLFLLFGKIDEDGVYSLLFRFCHLVYYDSTKRLFCQVLISL